MKNILNIFICIILLSFVGCEPIEPTSQKTSVPEIAQEVIFASMDDATEIMKKYGYANRVIRYINDTKCCEFSDSDKSIIQCQLSEAGYVNLVMTSGDPYWTCEDFNSALGYFIEWEESSAKIFNCYERESEIGDITKDKIIGKYGASEQERKDFINYLKNTTNQNIWAEESGVTARELAYYIAFGPLGNSRRYYVMYQLAPSY